jgi:hypothetical protein
MKYNFLIIISIFILIFDRFSSVINIDLKKKIQGRQMSGFSPLACVHAFYPEDAGSMFLRIVHKHLPNQNVPSLKNQISF